MHDTLLGSTPLCGIREVLHGSVHIIHRSYRGIVYRHRASFIPPLLLNMFDVCTPLLLVKFQEVPEHAPRMSLERRALPLPWVVSTRAAGSFTICQ